MGTGRGWVGGVVLGGLGLALAILMADSLVFEGTFSRRPAADPPGLLEVPVFFLERSEWRVFTEGVRACALPGRGLARLLTETEDRLLVETTGRRRPVRFAWTAVRGEGQTRAEVGRALESPRPPVALVGSSNTVLTVAMAEALRTHAEGRPGGAGGPLLLVPWATSMALLETYPGRTFRFCSNNRREAELVVDRLRARPGPRARGGGPRRAVLVVDRLDPYSVDLAACFRRAIAATFPGTEVVEANDTGASRSGPSETLAGAAEQGWARAIWRDVIDGPGGETWVVLPLQSGPARRMLLALNGAAPGRYDAQTRPLAVVCGDSIGRTTLAGFANQLVFPVWSASTVGGPAGPDSLDDEDVLEQAEIVAAILLAVDASPGPPTPDALRASLVRAGPGEPPAPFGRPIAFGPDGERSGFDPGAVLSLGTDSPKVVVHPAGGWAPPEAPKTQAAPASGESPR